MSEFLSLGPKSVRIPDFGVNRAISGDSATSFSGLQTETGQYKVIQDLERRVANLAENLVIFQ